MIKILSWQYQETRSVLVWLSTVFMGFVEDYSISKENRKLYHNQDFKKHKKVDHFKSDYYCIGGKGQTKI